jgi:succinate dehydrogenase/fumarate reductase flavoprotein subunit
MSLQPKTWDGKTWDLTTDVVVVGAGGAGLISAINAHDGGAKVLVLEKMKTVGGITILAAAASRPCAMPGRP